MSYTLAKTLHIKLGQVIKDLESRTSNVIMTTDEISSKMFDSGEKHE